MLQLVCSYIARHRLLNKEGRYLVALSGGADSVALLRVMHEMGYQVEAAHCNFHLRGEESDRDEQFCKDLCAKLNVPIHLAHFDTRQYASLHRVSIEMAARDLRYNYFRQLLQDLHFEAVCVAHHRDDQAETVMLNMLRGTGVEGLKGMLPKNDYVVRPLLCVSRTDINDYLSLIQQDYIVDSSNLTDDVQRNKLRLNVFPLMKTVTPDAVEKIARCAEFVADALPLLRKAVDDAIARVVSKQKDGIDIDIEKLRNETSVSTILWYILKEYDFSSAQTEQISDCLDGRTGSMWSSDSHELVVDRSHLLIRRKQDNALKSFVIPESGVYVMPDGGKIRIKEQAVDEEFSISRSSDIATIDADKVHFPLTLRLAAEGDRFVPFGMNGSKLVSDYLTDRKVSLLDKKRQRVLVDTNGDILWLIGRRTSNVCAIKKSTTRALVIDFE